MGKGHKQDRLGEQIRRVISELLLREIRDPRISGMVSVNAVDISPDGKNAKIFVSSFVESDLETTEEEKKKLIEGLEHAKGLIKREIGRQVRCRYIPELHFKFDESYETGRHISELIDKIQH